MTGGRVFPLHATQERDPEPLRAQAPRAVVGRLGVQVGVDVVVAELAHPHPIGNTVNLHAARCRIQQAEAGEELDPPAALGPELAARGLEV